MSDTRIEKDSMGEMPVPSDALYGASTQRAVLNFPVSGEPVESGIVRLEAVAGVSEGTPSIGSFRADISGSWSDSLTFTAPGSVGGFEVVPGMAGTADMLFHIDGTLARVIPVSGPSCE